MTKSERKVCEFVDLVLSIKDYDLRNKILIKFQEFIVAKIKEG